MELARMTGFLTVRIANHAVGFLDRQDGAAGDAWLHEAEAGRKLLQLARRRLERALHVGAIQTSSQPSRPNSLRRSISSRVFGQRGKKNRSAFPLIAALHKPSFRIARAPAWVGST
jgi:hypothetical protein